MRTFLSYPIALLSLLALAGCVSVPAPAYQPGIGNTRLLLDGGKTGISLGKFDAAPGVENEGLGIRGSTLSAGGDGTFSTYVRDAVRAELDAAARYEPGSPLSLACTLTGNSIDSGGIGSSKGEASVSARFVLSREGVVRYDRTLTARHQWDSSFIGAIAIPAAIDNYPAAVQKLVERLFSDPDFERAQDATSG
ncbi:MAG TPA: hypothetical protein VM619_13230 [Luteimonas sp.]|nr:hypothetical protein [Luteimonas sp.]